MNHVDPSITGLDEDYSLQTSIMTHDVDLQHSLFYVPQQNSFPDSDIQKYYQQQREIKQREEEKQNLKAQEQISQSKEEDTGEENSESKLSKTQIRQIQKLAEEQQERYAQRQLELTQEKISGSWKRKSLTQRVKSLTRKERPLSEAKAKKLLEKKLKKEMKEEDKLLREKLDNPKRDLGEIKREDISDFLKSYMSPNSSGEDESVDSSGDSILHQDASVESFGFTRKQQNGELFNGWKPVNWD